jgi:hypothetical protein
MGILQEPDPSIERFGDIFSEGGHEQISCAESDQKKKKPVVLSEKIKVD